MNANRRPPIREVLEHALGGYAPPGFLEHLIRHRERWDDELVCRLDEIAYELTPDLAVWQLDVDDDGRLRERREPLV